MAWKGESTLNVGARVLRRLLLWRQGLLQTDEVQPWQAELRGDTGALEAIRRLECVQVDPVSAVAPNHHLVLAARVGGYRAADLEALYPVGRVFEYASNARCVLPTEDLPTYAVVMEHFWRAALASPNTDVDTLNRIVEALGRSPGQTARQLGTASELWSAGYMPAGDTPRPDGIPPLGQLLLGGRAVVARRAGIEKGYALPERVLPPHIWSQVEGVRGLPSLAEALEAFRRELRWKYYRALRVFDLSDFRFGWTAMPAAERRRRAEEDVRRGLLREIRVEGLRRPYFVLAEDLDHLDALDRADVQPFVAFVPPLDNLLWSRRRLEDLFGFSYTWEVYTPKEKRTFGYYAMPIVEGDRLVGRLDPRLDRGSATLRIERIALEDGVAPDRARVRRLSAALDAFARAHGASGWTVERAEPDALLSRLARAAGRS
ncbi:MAG: YcaQ family DNA glycosylase [Clostridia bacterium]|nr:YcaQ family DNA glycosylase [Clostridia bacterium]